MSSSNRTTSKGGKGAKADNKSHKSDKSDSGKGDKQQANRGNAYVKSEDPSIKEKVRQLMEMSQKSEEEVCSALHECDNDVFLASDMLLEEISHGEWEMRVKKKKNRQASVGKQEKTDDVAVGDEWNENVQPSFGGGGSGGRDSDKDKLRNKGGPPRLHGRHNDSRGWRGREKQENERNLEDGGRSDFHNRRGRPGGSTRSTGGGRGRGGGRAGGRYPPRGSRSSAYNKPIDTWDNSNTWDNSTAAATNHTETWDDFRGTDEWQTEEYTGSLADTKVFTPSVQVGDGESIEASLGVPIDNAVINSGQLGQSLQQQLPSQSPVQLAGTLNAAQTQYLSQLTQQNSDNIKQYGSAQTYHAQNSNQVYSPAGAGGDLPYNSGQQYGTSPNAYVNSSYPQVNNNYGSTPEQLPTQQPARTKTQRARVPPPSKIPASAVVMPGDLNSSISYLDVQFGAMDFLSEGNSFDGVGDVKYGGANTGSIDTSSVTSTGNMDLNAANQNPSLDYSSKSNAQSSISSALSQSLTNTDSIPQTSEHLTGAYSAAPRSASSGSVSVVTPSGLELKQGDAHSYSQSSTYNSYQPKSNSYNASTYSGAQTTANSYASNQGNSSYVNSQAASYNTPSSNTYQNAYSSAVSYQSNANAGSFPSMTQANSYPSNNQSYQQNSSQSVYGTNAGLNNSSNFGNTTTSQYNSYSSASNHKLGKDSSYDSASNTVSNVQTTSALNSATSTATLSTISVTKSTASLAKNSSSVVSNIPPGVAPVMSTPYIMGQVPYFQPPVYSYEEMQMLQQRMPHMTTPYYDLSYQTPTTLAAVRDGTLGNVGYSLSDGRFTRGDNNASPVPSTLSQQTSTLTQGHQAQPLIAGTGPPYFFTTFNTLPNYAQFGTMYTQLPAATNAHGSTNSTQYPKPATYGSGYGSYDALSQTADYNKSGYVSNSQGQKGAGVNATSTGSSANDLSAMYGKSHAALGKVNSYDKQFHSGTPPPFTGPLHGGQNAGLAPSGTAYAPQVYIPTMTPHQQQLSTQLMHQPLHQMDVRHQGRRVDSGNSSGQRSQASSQAKAGAKQQYQASYWNQA